MTRYVKDGQEETAMIIADLNEKLSDLEDVYNRFFHGVCGMSCVYKESQSNHLNCCDWSTLIDDFNRTREQLNDIQIKLENQVYTRAVRHGS